MSARRFRASEGPLWVNNVGKFRRAALGATLESAETPRTPAQGGAAAEPYGPPLVDGERWPRPAPRGVSERVAAPVMSALAHVALVAGLLLASPIGPPIDTPEFIEIPVEVVALPPQGEAAATPVEPAEPAAAPAGQATA